MSITKLALCDSCWDAIHSLKTRQGHHFDDLSKLLISETRAIMKEMKEEEEKKKKEQEKPKSNMSKLMLQMAQGSRDDVGEEDDW